MILEWFNARAAVEVGSALADQFAPAAVTIWAKGKKISPARRDLLMEVFRRAEREVPRLELNIFRKAKFANSFKWRLIENGVEKDFADELTQHLVLHLSGIEPIPKPDHGSDPAPSNRHPRGDTKYLLAQGNKLLAVGAYAEAVAVYQDLLILEPSNAHGLNNLGAALSKLGCYDQAEANFQQAVAISPHYAEPHCNLGNVLRWRGRNTEAEGWLRRAVNLNPKYEDARINLGLTLVFLDRLREAEGQFRKVLKIAPRNADALFGMGHIAEIEGHFGEANVLFNRALEINPKLPSAWAALVGIRKMTLADSAWLEGAEKVAKCGLAPLDEADMRFAIGKYYDDVGDFDRAFQSYRRGNELLKTIADKYQRDSRTRFVDNMAKAFTREALARVGNGPSVSTDPVFIVGMPRSGTSLVEQIIASHPSANGAGELPFWGTTWHECESAMLNGLLPESMRKDLAQAYLRALEAKCGDAPRIVDKSPVNSDYVGLIHSIFPNARIIYMRRDPIDTCLSCYFQKFAVSLNYTMDLSDLAHYYREHHRLMAHWLTVLPAGTVLEVPYSELITRQEDWTRKILDFLGLEWDQRCLDFHKSQRPVVTSSFWQVRQKIYLDSLHRSRNYRKFIGPLMGLKDLSR